MMFLHAVLLVLVGIAFLVFLVNLILKRKLREKYALLWLGIGLGVLFSPVIYFILNWLYMHSFFPTPTATFLLLAVLALALICLQISVAVSTAWRQRKDLAQRLALLELELKNK